MRFFLFLCVILSGCVSSHMPDYCEKMKEPIIERTPSDIGMCLQKYEVWLSYMFARDLYNRNLQWPSNSENVLAELKIMPDGNVEIQNIILESITDEFIKKNMIQHLSNIKFPKGNVGVHSEKVKFVFRNDDDSIKGNLSLDLFKKSIDKNSKIMTEAYQRLLLKDQNLKGKIYYTVSVSPNGIVSKISVYEKDIFISNELAIELEKIISKIIFPESENGAVITYPINLYPN